jgi:hypothetical protein
LPCSIARWKSPRGFFLAQEHNCTGATGASYDETLWVIRDAGDGVTPVSFDFPTPLQWKAPANTKACLFTTAGLQVATDMNAVGFYGG